ncbi:MAG: 4'-phosphopantetheinyl transferase superfamily protein [Gammaproteobacteria bacterium]|nr:4'-phosphopantetheinyl transferase superfamily protein [Gammaproteobacteria bacterium]
MTCEAVSIPVHSTLEPLPFLQENCSWLWHGRAVPLVHCSFDISRYRDTLFDELQIPLPASIRQSVLRRRAEYLAGRYCALRALDLLCLQPVSVGRDKLGIPTWPQGFTGSISHCRGQAVALVVQQDHAGRAGKAHWPGLGIDIEEIVPAETAANIECRLLDRAERAILDGASVSRQLLLTLMFSAKESFFKAAYPVVGRYFDFDAVSVIHIEPRLSSLRLRINQPLHSSLPTGRELDVSCQLLATQYVMTRVFIHS